MLAFIQLGSAESPSEATVSALEAFCRLYVPKTKLTTAADARWWFFKRKRAQAENLPKTTAVSCTYAYNYQKTSSTHSLVQWCCFYTIAVIPPPLNYGWNLANGLFSPVMKPAPYAPKVVTELVKHGCGQTWCSNNQCKYKKNGLFCTEFCSCLF